MYLLPAIDILGGKAVRLAKGDYAQVTVYNDDPVDQARIFQAAGATWMHVVDLDGAKSGKPENIQVIKRILEETDLNVEVGGGIRSLETIQALVDAGVSRMVLGTALIKNPDLGREAIARFGADRFSAGIDAKGGEVAIAGWREGSGVAATELAKQVAELGFKHLVYTDIARDGMQCGIEPEAYARMAEAFGNPVIASGGVASTDDIFALAPVADCIEGVITGRAIYEGTLDVVEGIDACRIASRRAALDQMEITNLVFNADGLIPCIVQDATTREVLMMAWMNAESLQLTKETGQTWFWSRSRQELWNKGATSGNTQDVVELRYDCDGDCLLALVNPAGPACHTGETTCFYRTLQ